MNAVRQICYLFALILYCTCIDSDFTDSFEYSDWNSADSDSDLVGDDQTTESNEGAVICTCSTDMVLGICTANRASFICASLFPDRKMMDARTIEDWERSKEQCGTKWKNIDKPHVVIVAQDRQRRMQEAEKAYESEKAKGSDSFHLLFTRKQNPYWNSDFMYSECMRNEDTCVQLCNKYTFCTDAKIKHAFSFNGFKLIGSTHNDRQTITNFHYHHEKKKWSWATLY